MRNDFPLSHELGEALACALSAPWSAVEQQPTRVPSRQGAHLRIPRTLCHRLGDSPCARTRRNRRADARCSPVSSRSVHRDDATGSLAQRDRRRAGSSPSRHHQNLCQGQSGGAASLGPALAGRCAMNTLREAVEEYLSMRRHLGFKLHDTERGLLDFVTFLEQRQAGAELLFELVSQRYERAAGLQSSLRGVDRDVRNRAPDRGAARPTDPSRPYSGIARPELPPQPQPRAKQGLDDLICASPPAGNCAGATPSLRFRLAPPPASSRPPRTISPRRPRWQCFAPPLTPVRQIRLRRAVRRIPALLRSHQHLGAVRSEPALHDET